MENAAALPDNVVAMRPVGQITAQDMRDYVREINDHLSRHDRIGLVADVTQLTGMTAGGLWEDLKAELAYVGQWHRFPKLAVIADGGFVAGMAATVDKALPQVEVRIFAPGRWAEAVAFAAQAGEEGEPTTS